MVTMLRRPWNLVPIRDSEEELEAIPDSLYCLRPHPYASLGAPYGSSASPFRLRKRVIERLLQAQEALRQEGYPWKLAIFDGWRPLAVQAFMVDYTIQEQCRLRGVDPGSPSAERDLVVEDVSRFWATPEQDPGSPPPHSTGAAVDLTLVDKPEHDTAGLPMPTPADMGSPIDAIGAVSEPDHFLTRSLTDVDASERERCRHIHARRSCLRRAMEAAGFAQHPNEWWHFSWGDQLWAWQRGEFSALYGRVDGAAKP